jgi:hypothetical protein
LTGRELDFRFKNNSGGVKVPKKSKYFSYRYFLVSASRTESMFPKTKNEVIIGLKSNLKDIVRISEEYKQRKYLLYFIKAMTENLYLLKLARERHYNKHEAGEKDIETAEDTEFPFVYVIIDFNRQITLIQKKSYVFQNISTSQNILQALINASVDFGQYIFTLDEISHKEKFWQLINKSSKIYSMRLNLRAPNLFGNRYEANKYLKEEQKISNAAEVNVELKNEQGNLLIKEERVGTYVDYIAAGGGSYVLRFKEAGEVKVKSSKDNIKTTYLAKNINQLNIAKIRAELEKIDEMNGKNEK